MKNNTSNESRNWTLTIHEKNMEKAGLTEEQRQDYPYLLNFYLNLWKNSGKNRTGCFTACISANGLFHIHGAISGEKTTSKAVSKLFFDSHVEPCKGGMKNLLKYIKKEPPYDEKGEEVKCIIGESNIKTSQGKRTDLETIDELLDNGFTPREIMNLNIRYRNNEKIIKNAYIDKKLKEAPIKKQMHREWHVGESGSGKSYCYERLCKKHNRDEIYLSGYTSNGWLDSYMERGAPSILFIDELKPSGINWQELLTTLDIYTDRPIHARYQDVYPLWTTVVITSVFPPEEYYRYAVKQEQMNVEESKQLLRRLDTIVYHYIEDGVYKEFSIPASEYKDYDDLKRRAKEEGGKTVTRLESES